jgi:hypothetical protein
VAPDRRTERPVIAAASIKIDRQIFMGSISVIREKSLLVKEKWAFG